ncbi:MAG: transcriptional regulator [Gemmatimonadetes bacterium]|nr:transcriptional regulator [Gemmatimonadota bacterium]MYB97013.1 transcriptional regulator [Gemmatimonadota bacterium]MYI46905.1 transcriptional regulator [Gemmatimonadota bacterium]
MTNPYSDPTLEALMADLESEVVERKESLRKAPPGKDGPIEDIRQAVCAFANDVPGHNRPGVVFVGARDDGAPSGIPITDRLLQRLADIKTDGHTLPPPTMSVEKRVLAGHDVAVVTVHPSDAPPVRARGRIWIRVGPRRAVASAQDERILNERRRHRDTPFDLRPLYRATLSDLHIRRFEEDYLPGALDPETLAANDRTQEERLAAARMILSVEDPVPTVVGMLALGRSPQDFLPGAYIQFLRIEGTGLADSIRDEARCTGDVKKQLDRLILKLDAHNRTTVDITSGPREIRRYLQAPDALRQIAYNAIMHRTYEGTNAPVRVTWYDDRVEIISPGGAYGAVTAEEFGRPGLADYRNPSLAEAMRVLGIVQRFGVGIGIARDALSRNEQEAPEFEVRPNYLRCTIRARTDRGVAADRMAR